MRKYKIICIKEDKYAKRLLKYKAKEKYKSDKREYRNSLSEKWAETTTKKIIWIAILMTIILWILVFPIIILSSPLLLSLPETITTTLIESTKDITVGLFATIVFYFIRAFMDSWSIAKTRIDISDLQNEMTQNINDAK